MISIARREYIHLPRSIEHGILVWRQLLIANVRSDLKSAYKKWVYVFSILIHTRVARSKNSQIQIVHYKIQINQNSVRGNKQKILLKWERGLAVFWKITIINSVSVKSWQNRQQEEVQSGQSYEIRKTPFEKMCLGTFNQP